jgi:maleate isomerase
MSADLSAPLQTIDLGVLPSDIDGGIAWRAAIGLVVLATDQTMEHEFRALLSQRGVAFYESRVFNDFDITPETLRAIGPRIAPSVDLILPSIPLDVVAFGCTSATMTLGEEAIFAEIRKPRPNVACTTPVTAALAAFRALNAKGVGLLTPYSQEINANLVAYFRGRGVSIAAVATFDRQDDREAARALDRGRGRAPRRRARRRCDLRLLHQSACRRGGGAARTAHAHADHLEQPCDGLALPASGGRRRCATRRGKALRTAHRLTLRQGSARLLRRPPPNRHVDAMRRIERDPFADAEAVVGEHGRCRHAGLAGRKDEASAGE